jgi:aminopeptidase
MTSASPTDDARLRAYAQLVIGAGVRLREGQELLVHAHLDHAPLARAIATEGYRAGARYVDVLYSDPWLRGARVADGPDDVLGWTPPWMVARLQRAIDDGAAVVGISAGSDADVFRGLDQARLARARFVDFERVWQTGVMEREMAWTLIAGATPRWAQEVFGEPDVDRLWDALAQALRLDEPDPAGAWQRRLDELDARARAMTERRFDRLRYRGPGTDLEVGLIAGARWLAGRAHTRDGHAHAANLPTEEVFTSPHRLRADGVVRSTLPLALRGALVEGLELRFAGGEIVEVRAREGEDVVRGELATDDGARRLGELALVDDSSRVGATGVTFRNTLLDENAASHIAWGQGFSWVLGEDPPADPAEHGVNDSAIHTDFMIGSPEIEVDGIDARGAALPLLRGGRWCDARS